MIELGKLFWRPGLAARTHARDADIPVLRAPCSPERHVGLSDRR
jgi:hypothetical protein